VFIGTCSVTARESTERARDRCGAGAAGGGQEGAYRGEGRAAGAAVHSEHYLKVHCQKIKENSLV